jgi:Protein of unknown function (DUF3105)
VLTTPTVDETETRRDRTVSKESRRAARLARESRRQAAAGRSSAGAGATPATPAAPPTAGGVRRAGAAGGAPGTRAGRRERVRRYHEPTFFERYRTIILAIAGVAVIAVAAGFVFLSSTSAAYSCGQIFDPSPTPTVSPGSSTRLGFVEDYMGNTHQAGPPFKYTYCPPASGNHYNNPGVLGPIVPRVYKPGDNVGPPNWVHNLEHGALVVLYKSDSPGATSAGQAAFKAFFDSFPPSTLCQVPPHQLSPVIAPFDQMAHPYAALVWGRVLYLDTWDPDVVLRFYATEAERLDSNGDLVAPPEDVTSCGARLKSAAPSASAPAESPVPSTAPSPAAS